MRMTVTFICAVLYALLSLLAGNWWPADPAAPIHTPTPTTEVGTVDPAPTLDPCAEGCTVVTQ